MQHGTRTIAEKIPITRAIAPLRDALGIRIGEESSSDAVVHRFLARHAKPLAPRATLLTYPAYRITIDIRRQDATGVSDQRDA